MSNDPFKTEFENTGHGYGFFTIQRNPEADPETSISCAVPLLKKDYEKALSDLNSVMSIASFGDISKEYCDSFAAIAYSMAKLDSRDIAAAKDAKKAIESFVEATVRTVTHFKTRLKDEQGEDAAQAFDEAISRIYDSGDSYALIYKLRNVYQHEGDLPTRLSSGVSENGDTVTKLILDGNKLLNEHTVNYLNKKVIDAISANPEIDIYFHALIAFDQVTKTLNGFIRDVLLDGARVSACARFIEVFMSLDNPIDYLFLTDIRRDNDEEGGDINLTQAHVPLSYFCKLISTYLQDRPELLFSFWGKSISRSLIGSLPGVVNCIGPEMFNDERVVEYRGTYYTWTNRTISFTENSLEMIALLLSVNGPNPGKEMLEKYWSLYQTLIAGTKLLSNINEGKDSEESVPL